MADETPKTAHIPRRGVCLTWGKLKAEIDKMVTDSTEVDYMSIQGQHEDGTDIYYYPDENRLTVL